MLTRYMSTSLTLKLPKLVSFGDGCLYRGRRRLLKDPHLTLYVYCWQCHISPRLTFLGTFFSSYILYCLSYFLFLFLLVYYVKATFRVLQPIVLVTFLLYSDQLYIMLVSKQELVF